MKRISTRIIIIIFLLCVSPLLINGFLIFLQEKNNKRIKDKALDDAVVFSNLLSNYSEDYDTGAFLDFFTALTDDEKIIISNDSKEKFESYVVYCLNKFYSLDETKPDTVSNSDFEQPHVVYNNMLKTVSKYPDLELCRFTYNFSNAPVSNNFYFFNPNLYRIRIISTDCKCLFDSQQFTTLGYHYEDYFDLSMNLDVYSDTEELRTAYSTGKVNQFTIENEVNGHTQELYTVKKFNFSGIKGLVLISGSFDSKKDFNQIIESYMNLLRYDFIRIMFAVLLVLYLIITIAFPLVKLSRKVLQITDKNGKIQADELYGFKRKDEIGDLSRSFSTIISSLNTRIEGTEELTADLSHEIKNPLAAIRILTDTIDNEELSIQEKNEICNQLQNEIKRIEVIIANIRQASKIESKVYESEKEAINCDEYLKNVISLYGDKFSDKNINSNLNSEGNKIFISPELLDIVFDNLISNAVSFADKVLITSKIGKQNLIITVEDNGPGVPVEERKKIFKRFYSNRKKQDSIKHDGLGLHLVEYIINSIKGNVSVKQSDNLGGANFIIEIPLLTDNKSIKKEKNWLKKLHNFLMEHTIFGSLILISGGFLIEIICTFLIDLPIDYYLIGEAFLGFSSIIAVPLVLILYRKVLFPEFNGYIKNGDSKNGFNKAIFFMLYASILFVLFSSFSCFCLSEPFKENLKNIFSAFYTSFMEETIILGLWVSYLMRQSHENTQIKLIIIITAVVYTIFCFLNISIDNLIYDFYCIFNTLCISIFLSSFYIRFGNLLICIIFRLINELIFQFCSFDELMMRSDLFVVFLILSTLLFAGLAISGLYLVSFQNTVKIKHLWSKKWGTKID